MPTLLLFATEVEARATIAALNATQTSESIYTYTEGRILISGMGCVQAAAALAANAQPYERLINIGLCGALRPDLPLYTIVHPINAIKAPPSHLTPHAQRFFQLAHPPFSAGSPTLVSVDHPIHTLEQRQELALQGDIVDMEGYGFAMAAKALNKPISFCKLVSDTCPDDAALILQRLPDFSERLASVSLKIHHFDRLPFLQENSI